MTKKNSILNYWQKSQFDKPFFISVSIVTIIGFLIFLSAGLGLQARETGSLAKLIINQAVFGLIGGSLFAYIAYRIPTLKLKEMAVPLFILSLALTLAVFIPGLGFSYGGATRWLDLGVLTLQPAELLKISTVLVAASWFSFLKYQVRSWRLGVGGLIGILASSCLVLLLQPDTGSAVIIIAAVGSIYLVAGGRWQHILVMMLAGIILLSALAFTRPYIKDRLTTFINPTSDPLGAGYQTQQSLIAVGSGKLFGRGPGQSIQKFNYLPEPISDSIFAVYAEEFGFLGSLLLVILYAVIALTGLRIALYLRSGFERLLVVGLVSMIIIQSVLNMGAMVGLFPLSGMPLIFVSHGGSALMFSLVAVGLVLNASTKLPKSKRIA